MDNDKDFSKLEDKYKVLLNEVKLKEKQLSECRNEIVDLQFLDYVKILLQKYKTTRLIYKGLKSLKNNGIIKTIDKVLNFIGIKNNEIQIINIQDKLMQYKIKNKIIVLTTKHCEVVARLIKESALKSNFEVEIIFEKPESGFEKLPHIVIAPQMFRELPDMYVAFQMEQSVSSRWFTDEYYQKLKNAVAIFDYSLENIEFLSKNIDLGKVFYMPISLLSNLNSKEFSNLKEYDIIFYGDDSCERRKKIINELNKRFKIKIINNLFGEELYKELAKSRIIINIHYYEGALLETTRLYECLSLNTSVIISERSIDMDEHKELEKIVDFVDIGNIKELEEKIAFYLDDKKRIDSKIQENKQLLASKEITAFDYYFHRFLLATDNINFDEFYTRVASFIKFKNNFWCLGLPEYTDRKKAFNEINLYGIEYFPGIRHYCGWVGCGMSYKFLLRKAKELGLKRVQICEDDVQFPADFLEKMKDIEIYLAENEWDVFSGLIADVNEETKIIKTSRVSEIDFIHIDKMVSMVFNIYNERFLDKLENWNSNNRDVKNNTIDRYIENNLHLDIITTLPFLVSCKESLKSTLWAFENSQYNSMIEKSNVLLYKKVTEFKKGKEEYL